MAYNWKKTAIKAGWSAAVVLLSGLIVVWQDDPKWLVLVPLVEAARNYIKHSGVVKFKIS